LPDHSLVFTGDCLLIRGCGRTDFQQGSAIKLFRSITKQIFTLPDQCLIYPAHDYQGRSQSPVGEDKRFNPRIGGGANETDFIGYMENMRLPHPRRLDEAVPANLRAGRPEDGRVPQVPDWAPVVITYSGILEVCPEWVATHLNQLAVLDVRSAAEQAEEPVHITGIIDIPLHQLRDRLKEIPQDRPVMTLCRSGRRSAMAFNILRDEGWEQVANVQGGLLRWHAEGLPS
jgi:rhodanese-related sulfurtransferase